MKGTKEEMIIIKISALHMFTLINKIMLRKRVYISGILGLAIFISACQEKIDLDLDDGTERLVVEAYIYDRDTGHTVVLSRTGSYYSSDQTPRITDAVVSVSGDGDTWFFTHVSDGVYKPELAFSGKHNVVYTLTVELDEPVGGASVYHAQDSMPARLDMDSITVEPLAPPFGPFDAQVKAWGQEPATPGNFYLWDMSVNGQMKTDTLAQKAFSDDEMINGSYIPGLPIFFFSATPGDTVDLYTHSITREYYKFIIAFRQEATSGGGNFVGPPANVGGNISGTALGFFSAKATSVSRSVYRK